MDTRRPRLAYPFTIVTQPDTVRLIAGEDYRYTFTGAGLDRWLPELLDRFQGSRTVSQLFDTLPSELRSQAFALVERLYGERVLVDGPGSSAHTPRPPDQVIVLVQDTLDHGVALKQQREARDTRKAFLWASSGAMMRAYVSPLFLPDAGPCFGCLLQSYRRHSPAPELYEALITHGEQGKPFATVTFPEEALAILRALVQWKLSLVELEPPPAALYRLHVLERDTMAVSTERVFVDPECPHCREARR